MSHETRYRLWPQAQPRLPLPGLEQSRAFGSGQWGLRGVQGGWEWRKRRVTGKREEREENEEVREGGLNFFSPLLSY